MDPAGGTNFLNMGATQLQYVPYAFYSYGVDAANVKGIVPVKSGGTGVATLEELKTALNIVIPASIDTNSLSNRINSKLNNIDTGSLSNRINEKADYVAPGTSGNYMISNGSGWVSKPFIVNDSIFKSIKYDSTHYRFQSNSLNKLMKGYDSRNPVNGRKNISIGDSTLFSIDSGYYNIAIGDNALKNVKIGGHNIGIGVFALEDNNSGGGNVAIGGYALNKNTRGINNTSVGVGSMFKNTTGANNTSYGAHSMGNNLSGYNNSAFGYLSLNQNRGGVYNSAFGSGALSGNIDGVNNTAIGFYSLQFGNGSNNVAIGTEALNNGGTSGSVAIGYNSLYWSIPRENQDTSGVISGNTAVGYKAMLGEEFGEDYGKNNTVVGSEAMLNYTQASSNVVIGTLSGNTLKTGNNNTLLGASADVGSATISNSVAIGYGAVVNTNNQIQLGNSNITDVKTSGIITASGFKIPNGTSAQYLRADGTVTTSVTSGVPYSGASRLLI
jgi:hypothetical protein